MTETIEKPAIHDKSTENVQNSPLVAEKVEIQREKGGLFKKGFSANPKGKKAGTRDFYTDFKKAIKALGKGDDGKKMTEIEIIRVGLEKMLKGDVRFEALYLDLMDRVYGKAVQPTSLDVSGQVEHVVVPFRQSADLLKNPNQEKIEQENSNDTV